MHISELKRNWNAFGRKDPLWAIITRPDKKGGKWNAEHFFYTGKEEIDAVMEHVISLGIAVKPRRALDFGCGVGRVTQALVAHFDHVVGVDIAASMLKAARKYNRFGERCRYYLNETDDLSLFHNDYFDFIYSNMVLQHMEPRYSKNYLREFVRVLAPQGVLVFQIPAKPVEQSGSQETLAVQPRQPNLLVAATQRLLKRLRRHEPRMEMYTITCDEIFRVIQETGAVVIDVVENDACGTQFISLRYCVVKRIWASCSAKSAADTFSIKDSWLSG
jgi:SAM-dependent methyltransferase